MMITLTARSRPTLRAVRAALARPGTRRALIWGGLLLAFFALVALLGVAHAQDINGAMAGTATKACTQVKSLSDNKWLKVFIVAGFGVAVLGVFRKQKDGWTNLIWVIVIASLVGIIWNIATSLGITC